MDFIYVYPELCSSYKVKDCSAIYAGDDMTQKRNREHLPGATVYCGMVEVSTNYLMFVVSRGSLIKDYCTVCIYMYTHRG